MYGESTAEVTVWPVIPANGMSTPSWLFLLSSVKKLYQSSRTRSQTWDVQTCSRPIHVLIHPAVQKLMTTIYTLSGVQYSSQSGGAGIKFVFVAHPDVPWDWTLLRLHNRSSRKTPQAKKKKKKRCMHGHNIWVISICAANVRAVCCPGWVHIRCVPLLHLKCGSVHVLRASAPVKDYVQRRTAWSALVACLMRE